MNTFEKESRSAAGHRAGVLPPREFPVETGIRGAFQAGKYCPSATEAGRAERSCEAGEHGFVSPPAREDEVPTITPGRRFRLSFERNPTCRTIAAMAASFPVT